MLWIGDLENNGWDSIVLFGVGVLVVVVSDVLWLICCLGRLFVWRFVYMLDIDV